MTSRFSSRRTPRHISASRTKKSRSINIKHYIVVEGEETEKKYFTEVTKKSPKNFDIKVLAPGSARETLFAEASRLIDELTKEVKALGKGFSISDVGAVWIVCDVDDEGKKLVELKLRGKSQHINWIISNPSFDAWIGMHFPKVVTGPVDRRKVQSKLKAMKVLSGPNNKTVDLNQLKGKYKFAREVALGHKSRHEGVTDFPDNNPSSDVYQLIDVLNEKWE